MLANIPLKHKKQNGNALFLILIAVVLFAALTYAITQGERGSGNSNARDSNRTAMSTVITYGDNMRMAAQKLLIRGFTINEITSNTPGSFGTNESIEMFAPNGGGGYFSTPDPATISNNAGNWFIKKNVTVPAIGTTLPDMVTFLTYVKSGICQQLNAQFTGGTTTVPTSTLNLSDITTLGTANTLDAAFTGDQSFCFQTADSVLVYYHVLIEQ